MKALISYVILLGLLIAEFFFARVQGLRVVVPYVGLGMAIIVAMTFMRLAGSRRLVPVFALAGLFWLMVMMGLGSMDSFTRHDLNVGGQPLEQYGR